MIQFTTAPVQWFSHVDGDLLRVILQLRADDLAVTPLLRVIDLAVI